MARMRKTHDLVVSTGEYEDNHGQKKKRWRNVGMMLQDPESGNISIKVEMLPVGTEWSGWMSAFPVDRDAGGAAAAQDQNQASPQQSQRSHNPVSDPF